MAKPSLLFVAVIALLVFNSHARQELQRLDSGTNRSRQHGCFVRYVVKPPRGREFATMLSLDGGGLRGIASNQILIKLEDAIRRHFYLHPKLLPPEAVEIEREDQLEVHLADFFDVIGGVSAGSWNALYYASKGGNGASAGVLERPDVIAKYGRLYPGSARGLDVFYREYGNIIFPRGILPRIPTLDFSRLFPIRIPMINSPRYPPDGLERALEDFYGDTKLTDLHTSFIAPVYDVNHGCPVLFSFSKYIVQPYSSATVVRSRSAPHYGPSPGQEEHEKIELGSYYEPDLDIRAGQDFYIRDVARGSSAVPPLFIAKEIRPIGNESYLYHAVDGALVAANPILHTANFLSRMQQDPDLHSHAIMSIGTGIVLGEWEVNVGRGALGWMASGDIMSIIIGGGSEAVQSNFDFFVYGLLDFPLGQYLRIQMYAQHDTPEAEALESLDDASQLDMLARIGRDRAKEYQTMIRAFVNDYLVGPKRPQNEDTPPTAGATT